MTAWDVSTATYLQEISVKGRETNPTGVFFNPDGSKMYTIGSSGDTVDEYDLSTPWSIVTAVYLQEFYVGGKESSPNGLFFKPDGSKMYTIGSSGDTVDEYNLSTAWNVTTATYLQEISVTAKESNPMEVFFNPDGTKMYTIGTSGDSVDEYDLSTPWDILTAVYLQEFYVGGKESSPTGVFFKPDGTKMYTIGTSGDSVDEYNLSTAWNVTTATYLQEISVGAKETYPQGVFFNPEGTKMYTIGSSGDTVDEYNLSTAWNVTTATYLQEICVALGDTSPNGLFFKPDGTKMYTIGLSGDTVDEYDLSTPWDILTAVYLQEFYVGGKESSPTGVFFKPDGTKMYTIGTSGDSVDEYNLSTSWSVVTAVYLQEFYVGEKETSPQGVFFKPDGTKMYTAGSNGDSVDEYDLSTPWSVVTAVYLQELSVTAKETSPMEVFFKPDGTKMYTLGSSGGAVDEYDLSTAWNVLTAVYLQEFYVGGKESIPKGLFFNPDGTKMYTVGLDGVTIDEYDLPEVTGTNMKINIGVDFKDVDSMQINIDGWKDVVEVQQNIDSGWRTVF